MNTKKRDISFYVARAQQADENRKRRDAQAAGEPVPAVAEQKVESAPDAQRERIAAPAGAEAEDRHGHNTGVRADGSAPEASHVLQLARDLGDTPIVVTDAAMVAQADAAARFAQTVDQLPAKRIGRPPTAQNRAQLTLKLRKDVRLEIKRAALEHDCTASAVVDALTDQFLSALDWSSVPKGHGGTD